MHFFYLTLKNPMVKYRYKRKKERMKMKKWMVFDRRMEVVGFVSASNYTLAFMEAMRKYRWVEYIQEC